MKNFPVFLELSFVLAFQTNSKSGEKANIFVSYVIKEFAHAFSCYISSYGCTWEVFPHASTTRYICMLSMNKFLIVTVLTFHTSHHIEHFGG